MSTLSIYTSHDRDLLFHGDHDACVAHGIRIKRSTKTVTLDGTTYLIVNQHGQSDGSASLWVVNL